MQTIALGASLVAIVALGALRARLWVTMVIATLILLLGELSESTSALRAAAKAAVEPATLQLVVTVALIALLAGLLRNGGLLDPMSRSLAGMLRSTRFALALLPGILGCLPVPGGAAMSAPMVDGLGEKLGLSRESKAAANLLFRHAWFFVFPLTPSLILAAHLSGLTVPAIIARQWPVTVVAIVVPGLLFLWKPAGQGASYGAWRRETVEFFLTFSPILVSVVLFLAGWFRLPVALMAGIVLACLVGRYRGRFEWKMVWTSADWEITLATEAIMVFAALVREALGTVVGALPALWRAPLAFLITVPFLAGFATGNPWAAVSIAIPALLPMVPAGQKLVYICLICGLAYQGYLVSPLHMCLVLTNRYFGVSLGQLYRCLVVPVVANVGCIFVLWLLTGL